MSGVTGEPGRDSKARTDILSARGDTAMGYYKGQTFTILGQPYWLALLCL